MKTTPGFAPIRPAFLPQFLPIIDPATDSKEPPALRRPGIGSRKQCRNKYKTNR